MKTSPYSSLLRWFFGFWRRAHAPAAWRQAGAHILSLQCEAVGDPGIPACRFLVEAVIEPTASDAAWRLDELTLLPPQAAELAERGEPADDLCRVLDARVMEDGRFQPAARHSCIGSCRVRLELLVRNGLRILRFRYRDALFGQLILPGNQLCAF